MFSRTEKEGRSRDGNLTWRQVLHTYLGGIYISPSRTNTICQLWSPCGRWDSTRSHPEKREPAESPSVIVMHSHGVIPYLAAAADLHLRVLVRRYTGPSACDTVESGSKLFAVGGQDRCSCVPLVQADQHTDTSSSLLPYTHLTLVSMRANIVPLGHSLRRAPDAAGAVHEKCPGRGDELPTLAKLPTRSY